MLLSTPCWAQGAGGAPKAPAASKQPDPKQAGKKQPDAKTIAAARTAFGKGKAAYGKSNWAAAHTHFRTAHGLIPTPHTLYWIAVCLDKQGKADEAAAAYGEYLKHPDAAKVGGAEHAAAKARLAKLQPKAGKNPETAAASTGAPAGVPPPAQGEKASGAAEAEEALDGSTYVVRMRDLEQRIDRLKEQIRRSHTRLSLLSETVLSGGVGGARAVIRLKNDLTTAFRVTRVLVVLDGVVQYNKQDSSGKLARRKQIPIFSGSIPPGDHTLQVLIKLRGHGYGVFSYLRGYKFEVKSAHSFTVTQGKTIKLDIIAWEKGGVTTPLEQRPAIRYVRKLTDSRLPKSRSRRPRARGTAGGSGKASVRAGAR
jgi:hypothetical protein